MYVAIVVFVEIDFKINADDGCMESKQEITGQAGFLVVDSVGSNALLM